MWGWHHIIGNYNFTATSTMKAFSTCTGVASGQQSFTVNGSNLTANIAITAPTGFEVSTTSGSGFGISVTLTQSSGSVSLPSMYVWLQPLLVRLRAM